jgi:hypothetical protein
MMVIPNRVRVLAVITALALAIGVLTLALLAKPTQAQGNGAVSEQVPIESTIDATECTGEFVDFTGTLHIVSIDKGREDGGYHITSHYNIQNVTAVGIDPRTLEPTGTEYRVRAAGTTVENFVADGELVRGTVDIAMTIGNGSLPNQYFFARVLSILTSEGEVKVDNTRFIFECR